MTTLMSKRLATFAAAAVGAAATLAGLACTTAVPAAHAESCKVNGSIFNLEVGNSYRVSVAANGSNLKGDAFSVFVNGTGSAGGDASGSFAGNTVDFIVTWKPPFGGGTTHFRGTVGADGFAHGTATGADAHDKANNTVFMAADWASTDPVTCPAGPAVPAGPAAPAGPAVPAAATATVTDDVDVYNVKNEPDGAGHVVGILRSTSQVQLVGSCQPQSWCQVSGAAVPSGKGWVWGALQLP
jgi:hypothetical protein